MSHDVEGDVGDCGTESAHSVLGLRAALADRGYEPADPAFEMAEGVEDFGGVLGDVGQERLAGGGQPAFLERCAQRLDPGLGFFGLVRLFRHRRRDKPDTDNGDPAEDVRRGESRTERLDCRRRRIGTVRPSPAPHWTPP